MTDVRGQKVGKYELLTQLTSGGMAELFLATVRGPGGFRKYVVLKRILPSAASDENFIKMFLDEARITAGFSHGGIAQVFDLGEDEQGHFVVLEFIAGRNLNQVVAACADQRAVLPLGFSAAVVRDCALALHYAHTYKKPSGELYPVVHRDVAQKNIMVTYDGATKLLDFGIAKASGALARTRAGTVKGTAGYMSPEQVQGEAIDGRSDLFSLGVVLWEMCTGRRLFSADTEIEELQLILKGEIQPPHQVEPVVPAELSAVIMKALSRERSDRYASGKDLAKALDTECAELLFDADQRGGFMKELFEAEVAATRGLFQVADERASQAEIDQAVQAFAGQKARPITQDAARPKIGTARRKPAPRRKKSLEAVEAARPEADLDEAQIEAAARAAALAAQPPPEPRSWAMMVVVALVLVGVAGLSWKVLVHQSGMPAFKGESVGDQPLGAIPGVDTSAVKPKKDDAPSTEPLPPTTPIVAVAEKDKPEKDKKPEHPEKAGDGKPSRGQGELTLALLPSATVYKGQKELGRGSIITVSLPVGTHLLTVVGADGVKHSLSVNLTAGKNKPMRLNIEELPKH